MSRKRKKNSRRPEGFVGRPRPKDQMKRLVVFLFGLLFIAIIVRSCFQSDLTALLWWHFLIMASMFSFGGYLVFIALFPRQSQVNRANGHLLEQASRSIFRALLDRLF
jgi:hypothetical protein